jgi:hypothetical protein
MAPTQPGRVRFVIVDTTQIECSSLYPMNGMGDTGSSHGVGTVTSPNPSDRSATSANLHEARPSHGRANGVQEVTGRAIDAEQPPRSDVQEYGLVRSRTLWRHCKVTRQGLGALASPPRPPEGASGWWPVADSHSRGRRRATATRQSPTTSRSTEARRRHSARGRHRAADVEWERSDPSEVLASCGREEE